MADVACSIPRASQDSRCGPRVVVQVAGDVPFGVSLVTYLPTVRTHVLTPKHATLLATHC